MNFVSKTITVVGASVVLTQATTFAATPSAPSSRPASMATMPTVSMAVAPKVAPKIEAFDLSDVTLLDGPFLRAMNKSRDYLLQLEPDRFLHNFRTNAGLPAKAPIYGGWESQGVAGQTLGHYMSGLALYYRATGDARFKSRLDYIVSELALCQQKNGDGYVSAIPDGKAMFADVAAGKGNGVHRGWVPWYTMHKLFAGLRDTYLYTNNPQAKEVLVKLSDWAVETTKNLNDEQWQIMLTQEHGGMNETLADVYALTGNPKYLELSKRFYQRIVLDPLASETDNLQGLHANTQVPKIIGMARLYELTGEAKDATISKYFWDEVVHQHSYVIGGNSDGEHFGAPGQLSKRMSPSTAETCNTYNMLKLTRHLFEWSGDTSYADYYERALYNHILASQEPLSGMVTYYVSLKPGHFKTYSTPFDSFWCCVGTGMENHVKYGDSIYFHDADNLYVNGFIPSILKWRDKGLTIRQETRFPQSNTSRLIIGAAKATTATIQIRIPSWTTSAATIAVNGRSSKMALRPGTYAAVNRKWKNGDRIDITLPMTLHSEAIAGDPRKIALLYGPIVLAGDLGREGVPPNLQAADQGAYFNLPDPIVPVLLSDNRPLSNWIKPVPGQALTFRTVGVGRPADITLRPFYDQHYNRYNVYWDVFTPADWDKRQAQYRAEAERRRALEAGRVDEFRGGEQQSEVDHAFKGDRSNQGVHLGRHWRDAAAGGSFSFDMKSLPDTPQELVVTYWGDEAGPRQFDVLVDGQVVGTENLNHDKPGEFFDRTYSLPIELTKGKSKITVRFAGKPDNMAGGIFGAWLLRQP